jgi:hypothetical protein
MFWTTESAGDLGTGGKNISEFAKALKDALENSLNPEKFVKGLTDAENQSNALQRSIGGVVVGADQFREKLMQAYKNTQGMNATFKDTLGAVQGLATGMGKLVNPSQESMEAMVGLAKGIGETPQKIGEMVAGMTRFGGTQVEAVKQMDKIAKEARKAGLDAKGLMADITTNLKKASGFGFSNSVNGLTQMAKQAKLLRTDIASIGAMSLQGTILEPEGAIQAAAEFQMLGGAVGKLADPFQLMHMAQSDLQGLQDELVKSTKSSYTFNKATGGFDIAAQDLYRLRQQAKITGADFDGLVNAGKEAAKLDYLTEKFNLKGLDKDTQNMVAGLAEIGEGGTVSIDIPGYKKIEADSAEQLKAQLQSAEAQKALKDYQDKADKDSKDLAIEQLSVTENLEASARTIRDAVLLSSGAVAEADRKALLNGLRTDAKSAIDAYGQVSKAGQEKVYDVAKTAVSTIGTEMTDIKDRYSNTVEQNVLKQKIQGKSYSANTEVNVNDGIFPSTNSAPTILSKGTLYKGIVGDDVAVGTNLTEALSKGSGGGIGGKLDININLTGSIGGDPGQLTKMFNSPQVQKQIMDTVLYKLNDYKRQQGVLS